MKLMKIEATFEESDQDDLIKVQKELLVRTGGFKFPIDLIKKGILADDYLLAEFVQIGINTDTAPMETLMGCISEELIGEDWPTGMSKYRDEFFAALKAKCKELNIPVFEGKIPNEELPEWAQDPSNSL